MNRLSSIFIAIAIALVSGTGSVIAAERIGDFVVYEGAEDVIVLDAEIDSGTIGDFRRALAARPNAKIVVLQSDGGYVEDALQLASQISARGMSTAIPRGFGCYSACAYVFFAGREHVVRGELGVHHVTAGLYNNASAADTYFKGVEQRLKRYRIPAGVIKAMVSTPPNDLHVFTQAEIKALSINRVSGKGSLAAQYAAK